MGSGVLLVVSRQSSVVSRCAGFGDARVCGGDSHGSGAFFFPTNYTNGATSSQL